MPNQPTDRYSIDDLDEAICDLNRTFKLPPYEGVDVAWVAVIKMANLLPVRTEDRRLEALLEQLPEDSLRSILAGEAVQALLDLEPPLESAQAFKHERLDAERTARELEEVRQLRETEPRVALLSLAHVLKRVRNRRARGFKTTEGPRDQEILSASVKILRELGAAVAEALRGG